ncbi:MAG: Asp-tRNA(Asn)/Glu-tRNA(Gln) amidotransferase subunit GatB [Burkholderiales bacterium]|nr:Asp-tRNA(Asn)/Glu-tRNA(Gln) amidotransferase subunit GatB [Burkholderiales bacterium]
MKWETVIGLETHAQLSTRSKIFSGAPTAFGAAPNTQACEVDIALPGVLPVLNRGAVERAIRFGLAVGGRINPRSVFARKNYFYPDLPKGYQISQYELPIVEGGTLEIAVGDQQKTVHLTRAHLEEDAGKSLHEDFHGMTGIDLNRAGTPLLEIVSEPDLRSSAEAVAYAKTLHALVRWIDICDGNMQEGSFRCDANVSVRPMGSDKLGTRCEIKNLNSFRFLERAIEFEVRRQIEVLEDGGRIVQETRLYDPDRDETRPMRSKEDAMDYRYFPDPDLLPLEIDPDLLKRIESEMPELPRAMRDRFMREFGLSAYDAVVLTASKELAVYYEAVARQVDPKLAANWVTGELSSRLNEQNIAIADSPVKPEALIWLIGRIIDGTISGKIAKDVFRDLWDGRVVGMASLALPLPTLRAEADAYIERMGLKQISDSGEIGKIVDQVLAANAQQVAAYRSGKEKAFNSLVGQVMKATKGKANPAQVNSLLKQKLGSS